MTRTKPGFLDALDALRQALDETTRPSMVIGGVAVIALGIPRFTADIDATIAGADLDLTRLAEVLAGHGIRPRIPDAVAFARSSQVFLGVHEASGTPVDLSLAWLPFEAEALGASVPCDYAGVAIRVPRAEDLLIYKIIALRARDIEDAEGLLLLHGGTMNLGRVRETVRQFAAVLDDSERPQVLEGLLRKAGLEHE
jgi:hypothetical protein